MATPGMIQVEGLATLDRALKELEPEIQAELKVALRAAAQPVRSRTERLTFYDISGMRRAKRSRWWDMRLGGGAYVYLAPASRNRGGSPRPNLSDLLLEEMRKGVEREEPNIVEDVEHAIDHAIKKAGF